MDILTLLDFKIDDFEYEPICRETDKEFIIYVELKIPDERKCPCCNSTKIHVKDVRVETIKHQFTSIINKRIVIQVTKRRFKCQSCHKTFTQDASFVEKRCRISDSIRWAIVEDLKEIVSFSFLARKYKISYQTVINTFDRLIHIGRAAMPTCLCIDEKRFSTDEGKFICVLGNARNSKVVDVIATRKKAWLFEYFDKIPEKERENTKFFVSDMFEGYRTVKKKFFPKAIHIIDHFHVKRLFTDALQTIRRSYMNTLPKSSDTYKFLKNKRKFFLVNPYSDKAEKMQTIDKMTGAVYSVKELINFVIKSSCPSLLEIHNLYSDFCKYMCPDESEDDLRTSLDFIINKALNSNANAIKKIGSTLLSFYEETISYFVYFNQYRLSNASAENINCSLQKIITVSNGLRDYRLFRKRILYVLKEKGIN